ncbi:hypothetical protein BDF19DRAFT_450274 [Syncephalis fuscata]|nr:hypothetical protein BDF19DRAFT_450274 [Syncephalis fuscata]
MPYVPYIRLLLASCSLSFPAVTSPCVMPMLLPLSSLAIVNPIAITAKPYPSVSMLVCAAIIVAIHRYTAAIVPTPRFH